MNNKLTGVIILSIAFTVNGCKRVPVDETATAFSMSDAMFARCEFYRATYEDVKNEIRLFGKIEADNNKMAQVFPVVGGVVKSINVGLGDYVRQGDLLANIQSGEIAALQKQRMDALNDVAIAEKQLQVATDLFEGKLNSEKDVTMAAKELEKAKAGLALINEIHGIYDIRNSSVFSVRAPISGFVISKKVNINELLLPSENEPIFSIANTNEIWAVAYVNESNISRIREGYSVNVNTVAFPDTTYKGTIEKIYNLIDPATKSMKFRVRIPNSNFRLKPDMNCTVGVHYSENRNLVAVPSSAVIFDKNKYWVMVFKDRMNIETRQVEIYRQLGSVTYVLSGIEEGETVISRNGLLIYDAIND